MGELMIGHAQTRGVQGIVLDGAVRDVEALAGLDIGVWACGATPSGHYKDGPGEIGYPVSCGGQVVMPGDLIVADADGVVVVPAPRAAAVIAAAEAHNAKEQRAQAAIAARSYDRGWVMEALKAKGLRRGLMERPAEAEGARAGRKARRCRRFEEFGRRHHTMRHEPLLVPRREGGPPDVRRARQT